MAKAAQVTARLGLDAKGFNNQLKKSQRGLKGFARQAKSTFGVGLGTAAIVAGTKALVDYADKIDKTAKKVGVGTKFLQEFRFAAEQTGVETRTTDMALQRFARRLGEAAEGGGELLPVLEKYNIVVKDAAGNTRKTEDVMADLANTIQSIEDPQERLRVAFKAFDSEGAALVNTLAAGSAGLEEFARQAQNTGKVVDEEAIGNLVKYKDTIDALKTTLLTTATQGFGKLLGMFEAVGFAIGGIVHGRTWAEGWDLAAEAMDNAGKKAESLGKAMEKLSPLEKIMRADEGLDAFQRAELLRNLIPATKTKAGKKEEEQAKKTLKQRAKEAAAMLKKMKAQDEANKLAEKEIQILELLADGRLEEAKALERKLEKERMIVEIMKEQGRSITEATAQAEKRLSLEEKIGAAAEKTGAEQVRAGGGGGAGGLPQAGEVVKLPSGGQISGAAVTRFAADRGVSADYAGQFVSAIGANLAEGYSFVNAESLARQRLRRSDGEASRQAGKRPIDALENFLPTQAEKREEYNWRKQMIEKLTELFEVQEKQLVEQVELNEGLQ